MHDSDPIVGIGYTSFDDYNEAHPFDELVETRLFREFYGNEINYESLEVSPHGTYMRIGWKVSGSEYYSIQPQ